MQGESLTACTPRDSAQKQLENACQADLGRFKPPHVCSAMSMDATSQVSMLVPCIGLQHANLMCPRVGACSQAPKLIYCDWGYLGM